MERLIYSNSYPSKLQLKPSPFLPRLGPVNASKSGISFASRTESWRVNSFSCCKLSEDPSHNYPSASTSTVKFSEKLSVLSTSPVDLPNGSGPKPNFLNQISDTILCQEKVITLHKFNIFPQICNAYMFFCLSYLVI